MGIDVVSALEYSMNTTIKKKLHALAEDNHSIALEHLATNFMVSEYLENFRHYQKVYNVWVNYTIQSMIIDAIYSEIVSDAESYLKNYPAAKLLDINGIAHRCVVTNAPRFGEPFEINIDPEHDSDDSGMIFRIDNSLSMSQIANIIYLKSDKVKVDVRNITRSFDTGPNIGEDNVFRYTSSLDKIRSFMIEFTVSANDVLSRTPPYSSAAEAIDDIKKIYNIEDREEYRNHVGYVLKPLIAESMIQFIINVLAQTGLNSDLFLPIFKQSYQNWLIEHGFRSDPKQDTDWSLRLMSVEYVNQPEKIEFSMEFWRKEYQILALNISLEDFLSALITVPKADSIAIDPIRAANHIVDEMNKVLDLMKILIK